MHSAAGHTLASTAYGKGFHATNTMLPAEGMTETAIHIQLALTVGHKSQE